MKNLTAGIYGIFRGLNFESDAEIGQKGTFFKGLADGITTWGYFHENQVLGLPRIDSRLRAGIY